MDDYRNPPGCAVARLLTASTVTAFCCNRDSIRAEGLYIHIVAFIDKSPVAPLQWAFTNKAAAAFSFFDRPNAAKRNMFVGAF
jgi:hypothetical protein